MEPTRRPTKLNDYSQAPMPMKVYLREQGRQQLETIRNPQAAPQVRVQPLVDEGLARSVLNRNKQTISGDSAQLRPLERQQQLLSKMGPITQRFGNRNPIERFSKGINYGTDIGVPEGTKVAVPEGQWEVVEAFNNAQGAGFIGNNTNRGYGNSVLVRNRETGEMLRFSHLSDALARTGQVLDGGTVVGLTGSTGNATGPHLDLEYYDQSGRLSDVLQSRYGGGLMAGVSGQGARGGGNPLERAKEVGKAVLSHLDPGNQETPVLGQIRQAMASTPLGRPGYANPELPAQQRITDALTRYGESFAGHSTAASRAFGRNLRNSPTTKPMPMEDIEITSGILERYLLNADDANYAIFGTKARDEAFLKDVAGHFVGKDILKQYKNDPRKVAQILLERVLLDRTHIPS